MTMPPPRITSIRYSSGPVRKKPQAGDEKVVKGVTYIRQQQFSEMYGAWVVGSRGQPLWEWVVKGSDRDRRARGCIW